MYVMRRDHPVAKTGRQQSGNSSLLQRLLTEGFSGQGENRLSVTSLREHPCDAHAEFDLCFAGTLT